MANFYVSAEAECGQCGARAAGARVCLSTESRELNCIPAEVSSPVTVECLPLGWEHHDDWRSGSVRVHCSACVAKEREREKKKATGAG